MNGFLCYVCGNPDVVQFKPVSLCQWHQTPPEDAPVDMVDNLDEVVEEEFCSDSWCSWLALDSFDTPIYPV
jgi:hypothetical protein